MCELRVDYLIQKCGTTLSIFIKSVLVLPIGAALMCQRTVNAASQNPVSTPAFQQQAASIALMQDALAKQRDAVLQAGAGVIIQRRSLGYQTVDKRAQESFFILPLTSRSGLVVSSLSADCPPLPPNEIRPLVDDVSKRIGIDGLLLQAVMEQESGFHPCAVSNKGAVGLMQLMPGTAKDMGVINVFDPLENMEGGAKFLKQLLNRYAGDLRLVLGAYNAGPANVDASGDVPEFSETQRYVRQTMERLNSRSASTE